ncbi:WXG100 family type VII secretion target [Rhodococcus spongiicola]|uniref:Outer membrane channel protein CpnT-like N-terminal domain-containing protein n=1 Tax=Rhodococcus spongiicola TaxID=2487352 RepID=A0A438AU92_9NOCA|nr:hypothetical protein [Rhodococcus spongiicola]RVW02276.1 hypothetical protein EF834_11680 [Rhodococcus spongiicola]
MPIYVRVDADPESCIECAVALDRLAEGVDRAARGFFDARDQSEEDWDGDAGDNFRTAVDKFGRSTVEMADRAGDLSTALRTFADEMNTVKERMTRAAAEALEAGLWVGPDVCFPDWIGDPEPLQPPVGPWSIDQLTQQAIKVAAYGVALESVAEARGKERLAHEDLRKAFIGTDGDNGDDWLDRLKGSAGWMAGGAALSYVGAAGQEADKWGAIAQTRATQVQTFRTLAAEAATDSVRHAATNAANTFAPAADDAARFAAQNSRLIGGQTGSRAAQILNAGIVPRSASQVVPKGVYSVGSKIPAAGVLFTGYQIHNDLQGAEDGGDIAKIVAKDAGGFLAGTAATSLLLASAAGGPATIAAVGVGVLVSYGVGELIEYVAD